jgi:hypothetical protein
MNSPFRQVAQTIVFCRLRRCWAGMPPSERQDGMPVRALAGIILKRRFRRPTLRRDL